MKRYNENVAFGFDRDFYKEREWLTPINKGPFYAIKIAPYSFTSIGGIKIDQYMHALDKNNQPVKGLYCTGMDAGGMYGDSYPVWFSGNAFGSPPGPAVTPLSRRLRTRSFNSLSSDSWE